MQFKFVLALTSLLGCALAAPAPPTKCTGEGYATFYDDNACNDNPGTAVSMANPGCVSNEIGRNSIYLQQSCFENHWMVWSPGTDCNCQNDCAEVPDEQGCWNLNGHAAASSFRFINTECDSNNC